MTLLRALIALIVIAVALGGAPSKSVTASVKDTSVNGIEGLNIQLAAPFNIHDYIVGFKYNFGGFNKAPESLFASKTFKTGDAGELSIDTDFTLADKSFGFGTCWNSEKLGFGVGVSGNTKSKTFVDKVGFDVKQAVKDVKVAFSGSFDIVKNKFSSSSSVTVSDAVVNLDVDTVDKDPVLSVSYKIDDDNTVKPSVSLRNGGITYGWTRKVQGGEVDTTFVPGDKYRVVWKDKSASGVWKTTADIPVDNHAGTKISFSRDWAY